jgi:hypothetical protein
MAIGGGVAMNSTAFAMPSATASMTCKPSAKGVMNPISGDGGGVDTFVLAEAVVAVAADAGAAKERLSPKTIVAIKAITAPPADRLIRNTTESCRKLRPVHSEKRERYRADTIGTTRCSVNSQT